MAFSRALFSAAPAFRHRAQIHCWLRNARLAAARHYAGKCGRAFARSYKQFLEENMKFLRSIIPMLIIAFTLIFAANSNAGPTDSPKPLLIYCIDVEGGQATLFLTPMGESLLIDTGWDGFGGRDADRIVAAAKDAGISKIDYVLITHYHSDHVGGVMQLAARIPVGAFIDHGDNMEKDNAPTMTGWNAYQQLLARGKY